MLNEERETYFSRDGAMVLILVLMEYAQWVSNVVKLSKFKDAVLILVLMEYAQWEV